MDKIKSEKKQHIKEWSRRTILFVFSPFVLGMGVALTIRANLGSSPITCPPYVLSRYDNSSLSVGEYIFCMQFFFVIVQWALLGKDFKKIQFLQLAVCLTFGLFSDFGMWATKSLIWQSDLTGYAMRWVQLFVAGAVLGLGVVLEVRSGVMLIPGEGLPITISKVFNMDFGKVKIVFDVLLVFYSNCLLLCRVRRMALGLNRRGNAFFDVLCWVCSKGNFAAYNMDRQCLVRQKQTAIDIFKRLHSVAFCNF